MLEIRPNCEWCDRDLPPDSVEARICTYECTFCATCADDVLENVCPNCGGGFAARPIRPEHEHRKGLSIIHHPASKTRIHTEYTREGLEGFITGLKSTPPEKR